MEFTQHQLQAIDSGQPVPVEIEGRSCMLLPGSLYSHMLDALDESVLEPDSSVAWSTADLAKILNRISRPGPPDEPIGFDPDDYPLY